MKKEETSTSFLLIENAQPSDSGQYQCNPSNAKSKSVTVHVLNGKYTRTICIRMFICYCSRVSWVCWKCVVEYVKVVGAFQKYHNQDVDLFPVKCFEYIRTYTMPRIVCTLYTFYNGSKLISGRPNADRNDHNHAQPTTNTIQIQTN